MFQILEKRRLNETTTLMRVHAPRVAKKAGPGQFIIPVSYTHLDVYKRQPLRW